VNGVWIRGQFSFVDDWKGVGIQPFPNAFVFVHCGRVAFYIVAVGGGIVNFGKGRKFRSEVYDSRMAYMVFVRAVDIFAQSGYYTVYLVFKGFETPRGSS
jgi:hypothetical protein